MCTVLFVLSGYQYCCLSGVRVLRSNNGMTRRHVNILRMKETYFANQQHKQRVRRAARTSRDVHKHVYMDALLCISVSGCIVLQHKLWLLLQ
jgi:hypothetical protein